MANKKPKTVNKIENLTVEIDYDKLAEAVVKAEKKANEVKSYTSNAFATLSGSVFRIAACLGILFSVSGAICGAVYLANFDWKNAAILATIFTALLVLLTLIVIFLFSVLLMKSAKEIEYEKDRQFVISVFSAIVSFTALIVALVALNK